MGLKTGVIGTGKVSISFLKNIKKKVDIIGLYDINSKHLEKALEILGGKVMKPKDIATKVDVIFFGTPDDVIEESYKEIELSIREQQYLFHFSGALSSQIFKRGYRASIHPVFAFDKIVDTLKGVYFGVEGDKQAVELAKEFIGEVGGRWFIVDKDKKVFYHLMCVFSSNMVNAILGIVEELGKRAGIENPLHMVEKLIQESVKKSVHEGPFNTLTGPVIRGDEKTINMHKKVLRYNPLLLEIYSALTTFIQKKINSN